MNRKILGICTALAALVALAIVPAMGLATSPVLTYAKAVATGQKITAIGEETAEFVGSNGVSWSCNDFWLTGSVHKNSETEITFTIEGASFANGTDTGGTEDCSSSLGVAVKVTIPGLTNEGGTKHWCIRTNNELLDEFDLKGKGCTDEGAEELTFKLNFTGLLDCAYKRSTPLTGSYTTNSSPATLKLNHESVFILHEQMKTSIFAPNCPDSEKLVKLSANLYTDTGTFAESTKDPLIIS
jgi:hypothetical protein